MITQRLPARRDWDLLVIGGGPCGLAAAWTAGDLKWDGLVLERGQVAGALRQYPEEMIFSSSSAIMEIGGLRPASADGRSVTVPDAVAHFEQVAHHLSWQVCTGSNVTRIERRQDRLSVTVGGQVLTAAGVVIATGQFDSPCRLGVPGEDLPHVSYYFDRGELYSGKSVVVVGGSYSALESAHSLVTAGAQVTVVHRRDRLGADNRTELRFQLYEWAAQGRLNLSLSSKVLSFEPNGLVLKTPAVHGLLLPADHVFVQIGYHADPKLLVDAGIDYTPSGMPEHDRTNGATTIPGLYLVGAASNGTLTGDRFGIKSGLPQARQAVYHFSYTQGELQRSGRFL